MLTMLRRIWDGYRFGLVSQGIFLVPMQATRVRLTAQGPRDELIVWMEPAGARRFKQRRVNRA